MPLNPLASVEVNAHEIVQLPDGTDFARGAHDQLLPLLFGAPGERNPLKYAEIFGIAKNLASTTLWMRFACDFERINGLRRAKGADMAALGSELNALVRQTERELMNEDPKYTLLGGMFYNLAIICRGLRRYRDAATAQRKSSAWYGLTDDVPKQLVAIFAAQVEEVSAAFVREDIGDIARSIRALMALRDHIFRALPEYPGWMKDNASIHIAWARMMAQFGFSDPERLIPSLMPWSDEASTAGQSRSPQWAQVFRTWLQFGTMQYEEVTREIPIDLPGSSANNAGLTIQIIRAIVERRLGRTVEATSRLHAVANHTGSDGGIPMVVARRLLM